METEKLDEAVEHLVEDNVVEDETVRHGDAESDGETLFVTDFDDKDECEPLRLVVGDTDGEREREVDAVIERETEEDDERETLPVVERVDEGQILAVGDVDMLMLVDGVIVAQCEGDPVRQRDEV